MGVNIMNIGAMNNEYFITSAQWPTMNMKKRQDKVLCVE